MGRKYLSRLLRIRVMIWKGMERRNDLFVCMPLYDGLAAGIALGMLSIYFWRRDANVICAIVFVGNGIRE